MIVLDPVRIATVYLVQGLMGLIYLYLGIKTLKRDTKRLNVIFAAFYLSIAIGTFINWIYAPLNDAPIVLYLNFLTNFSMFFGVIFLVIFNLILLKSEKIITSNKQIIIIVAYGLILGVGMFVLIHIPETKVYFDPEKFSPIWPIGFYLYVAIIVNSLAMAPALFLLIQVYKKIEDQELKQKFKFFSIGVIEILIFANLIFLSNFLNNGTFRTISAIIGFLLVVSAAYLMYNGVGRQIS